MKNLLLGLLFGMFLPLIGIYLFVVMGGMPVATEGKSLFFERFFVRKAMHAAIQNELDKKAPFATDETGLLAGAHNYVNQCAGCHGLPGSKAPRFASTMFPPAPQLFSEDENVSDDPEGIPFWKIKNGIRLTGMPAFKTILSETEIWQLSLLLIHPEKFPQSALKTR